MQFKEIGGSQITIALVGAVLLVAFFLSYSFVGFDERTYERRELISFMHQAKGYFSGEGDCVPKYEFEGPARLELVEEFLSIRDEEVSESYHMFENDLLIFLKREKPMRPGLHLTVTLENESCKSFDLHELVH